MRDRSREGLEDMGRLFRAKIEEREKAREIGAEKV